MSTQPTFIFDRIQREKIEQHRREQEAEARFTRVRDTAYVLRTTREGVEELMYGYEMHLDRPFVDALVQIGKGEDLCDAAQQLYKHMQDKAWEAAERQDDE